MKIQMPETIYPYRGLFDKFQYPAPLLFMHNLAELFFDSGGRDHRASLLMTAFTFVLERLSYHIHMD